MEQVLAMARPLLDQLKGLTRENSLPARADEDCINAFVIEARRSQGTA
jgi:hypothetical protein